jgi:flavin-binding protein dodecin
MPSLVERMAALMGVADGGDPDGEEAERSPQSAEAALSAAEKEAAETGRPVRWLELDECGLDDAALVALRLGERFPVSLEGRTARGIYQRLIDHLERILLQIWTNSKEESFAGGSVG